MEGVSSSAPFPRLPREASVLLLAAAAHLAAAAITLGVVLWASDSAVGRTLVWALNANAIYPVDYAEIGATSALFQIAVGVFVARGARRLSRGAPFLPTTAMLLFLTGAGALVLSAFGGGGVVGIAAGIVTASASTKAWKKLAPDVFQPSLPTSRQRALMRLSPLFAAAMVGLLLLSEPWYQRSGFVYVLVWWSFWSALETGLSVTWRGTHEGARGRWAARIVLAGGVLLGAEAWALGILTLPEAGTMTAFSLLTLAAYEVYVARPSRKVIAA